jgi:hypothetical protein
VLLPTGAFGHETAETNCSISDTLPARVTVDRPVEATSATWVPKAGSVVVVHHSKTTHCVFGTAETSAIGDAATALKGVG